MNETAFPITPEIWASHPDFHGMTLRDWFAGQALAGLLASNATYGGSTSNHRMLALDAYTTADEMLVARAPLSGSSSASTEGEGL